MKRYGFPPEVVDAIVRRATESDRGAEVLPTAERLLGRPARRFTEWAQAHAAEFAGG